MCHQTVGLIAGELESRQVATVCLSVLPDVSSKVGAPRVLTVPYPLGYPLGRPGDPPLQLRILRAALTLLSDAGPPPVRSAFSP